MINVSLSKKIKYFEKDEKTAVKEYEEAAEMAASEVSKKMFMKMAKDEAKHAKMLDVIKEHEKEPKKKKSFMKRIKGKEDYEEKVKKYFEKEGVYKEQDAEDDVAVDRPIIPEENEWAEDYEERG